MGETTEPVIPITAEYLPWQDGTGEVRFNMAGVNVLRIRTDEEPPGYNGPHSPGDEQAFCAATLQVFLRQHGIGYPWGPPRHGSVMEDDQPGA